MIHKVVCVLQPNEKMQFMACAIVESLNVAKRTQKVFTELIHVFQCCAKELLMKDLNVLQDHLD